MAKSTVSIRVAPGRSYAGVLEKLRKEAYSDASRTRVVGDRPTKKEGVFFKIGGLSNKVSKKKLLKYLEI